MEYRLKNGEKVHVDELCVSWGVYEIPLEKGGGGLYQPEEADNWQEMSELELRRFWMGPQERTAN
jgi:hypothetical protein